VTEPATDTATETAAETVAENPPAFPFENPVLFETVTEPPATGAGGSGGGPDSQFETEQRLFDDRDDKPDRFELSVFDDPTVELPGDPDELLEESFGGDQ